ncbi:MAG: FkbM family methyltransferase [candidate division WOR-3 bacterium]
MIFIYKLFCYLYYFFYRFFKIKLRGIGVLSDYIKKPFIFKFENVYLFFNPKISRSYNLLVISKPNEEGTHLFLDSFLEKNEGEFQFLNIGASIGEFLIKYAKHPKIKKAIGFEPIYEAYKSLKISKILNDLENLEVFNVLIGNREGIVDFYYKPKSPTSSSIKDNENSIVLKLKMESLDNFYERGILENMKTIMLIDVEGAEYEVILGGIRFISDVKPLIIMEYNQISRKFYNIENVLKVLPKGYYLSNLEKTSNVILIYNNL